MGTGIVANAAAVLPLRVPGLQVFATVVWALAATVLIALIVAWSVHWTRYPERARAHPANPVMAQFWGAGHGPDDGGDLGSQAAHVLPAPYAAGAAVFALLYGVPTWGFAMMWSALAAAITVRTARRVLPFALTWWSFTFPVGTCVTGTIALAARSGADVLRAALVVLFALLVAAWLVVAARTVAGSATGRLFKPI